MIEFANIDNKLLVAIFTPILLAIGYFYRARKESIKNRKIALYILLEIWHRISVFYRKDFDDVFDQLEDELKRQLPGEDISENDIRTSKKHFIPILMETARGLALSDLDNYQEKYQESVSLISSDDPIFAYQISSASKTKKLLRFIDSYLEKSLSPIEVNDIGSALSHSLKSHMTRHAELESINDLECDIRKLSLKIGIFVYLSSVFVIRKRRKALAKLDRGEVEYLVRDVLIPSIREIKKLIQPTANASAG